MELGERLRKRRLQLNLTQTALAIRAGTTQGHISSIENGLAPRTSGDMVIRLANALQITTDELLGVPRLRGDESSLRDPRVRGDRESGD